MPYIPKVSPEKKREWMLNNGGLSYEDVAPPEEDQGISYEDVANIPQKDDRDWRERAQGGILNFLDMATFGYGDELVAAGGQVFGDEGDYDKNLKDVEAKHQRYRELEDDWSTLNIGSGAAGLVTGVPIFNAMYKGVAKTTSMGGKILPKSGVGKFSKNVVDLAGTGAVAGAVSETGHATGDMPARIASLGMDENGVAAVTTAAWLANAAPKIGTHALFGATLGVAAPVVTRAGQRLLTMLRNPTDKAARLISEKFYQSGKTIDDFANDWEAGHQTGKPVAPVDVAPQSVRDVGTAAARMPGPGRDKAVPFLEERQAAQGVRVQDDLHQALGKEPGSFVKTVEDIEQARAVESKPHYDKAFAGNKPVTTPKIVELSNRPSGKEAINRGLKMARDEGIAEDQLVIRDANGNIIGYTMKALHYAKMALDDMIDSAIRSGNNQAARNLRMLKTDWLKEMDAVSPDYAKGRKIYAGHSANKQATEMGRQGTKQHPDQIKADLDSLSPGEQEFYRQGFMQKLIEDLENSPDKANMVNRLFGTKAKRDRVRAIVGEDNYKVLEQRFGYESKMHQTYQDVLGGSPTAQRSAAQADIDNGIIGMSPEAAGAFGKTMITGNISYFINVVGWQGFMNMLRGIGQKTRHEIVKLLFSTDPKEVRVGMDLLRKHYNQVVKFEQRMENVGRTGAGAAADDDIKEGALMTGAAVGAAGNTINPF